MRRIKVVLSIGYVGCELEEEFEVEDNATEEEIAEMAQELIFDRVDWSYWELKDGEE